MNHRARDRCSDARRAAAAILRSDGALDERRRRADEPANGGRLPAWGSLPVAYGMNAKSLATIVDVLVTPVRCVISVTPPSVSASAS